MRLLQTLLVRRRTLPGLIEEQKAEIKRRRPTEDSGQTNVGEVREPEAETVIEADTLMPPAVIAAAADLDSWLAGIREKLSGFLKAGRRIKVMGSRKET